MGDIPPIFFSFDRYFFNLSEIRKKLPLIDDRMSQKERIDAIVSVKMTFCNPQNLALVEVVQIFVFPKSFRYEGEHKFPHFRNCYGIF